MDGFRFDYIGGEPYTTWDLAARRTAGPLPGPAADRRGLQLRPSGNSVTHGYDAQWGGNHTDGWGGGGNNFNQVMITALTENGFAWRGAD